MKRALWLVAIFLVVAVPAGLAVYAFNADSERSAGIDDQIVDNAIEVAGNPLDITPQVGAEAATPPINLSGLAEQDRDGAVALVRQALLDDPSIIREALAALEVQERQQQAQAATDAIQEHRELLFDSERSAVIGNPEGAVTIVEFLDYNCGHCRRAHTDLMRLLAEAPDVRVVIKEFPVLGPESIAASRVSIAAKRLGVDFTTFLDRMMLSDGQITEDSAMAIAIDMGIEEDALVNEMDNDEIIATLRESYALADALQINGTPAYVVGEELIMGAVGFDRLVEAVQSYAAQ